jgi:hypothetical protein
MLTSWRIIYDQFDLRSQPGDGLILKNDLSTKLKHEHVGFGYYLKTLNRRSTEDTKISMNPTCSLASASYQRLAKIATPYFAA